MNKSQFLGEKIKNLGEHFMLIPMIASEKLQQNLSDYNQFLLKKRFEVMKNRFFLVQK